MQNSILPHLYSKPPISMALGAGRKLPTSDETSDSFGFADSGSNSLLKGSLKEKSHDCITVTTACPEKEEVSWCGEYKYNMGEA